MKFIIGNTTFRNFRKPFQTKYECLIFLSVIIKNITNFTIPNWITSKLTNAGLTPLNNLFDLQNYILLETGYPFVFYDLDKITSKINNSEFNLRISTDLNNQKFFVSNEVFYKLDNSTLY